ncbi:MAG: pilin [Chloroflexota bacterium]
MKRVYKPISLLLIFLILGTLFISCVSFAGFDTTQIDTIKTSVNSQSANSTTTESEGVMKTLTGKMMWVLKYVGFILGSLLVVWFGIKWMTSGPNDRAALKEQAWNYVIGAVLLFGAIPLASWIFNIVKGIN